MNNIFNPLYYFPQGGKDDLAPSPVGEGWEGGCCRQEGNW